MKISRRDFLRMAAYTAAAAGVTQFDLGKLNEAFAAGKPPVIWLEGLGDQGCVVSAANYFDGVSAGIESVLLNNIELKFNSVLMGACGQQAIDVINTVYSGAPTTPGTMPPSYILVLTGALSNLNGYCIVGENTGAPQELIELFVKLEARAKYVIFAGACACYGGVNAIGGNQYNNVPEAVVPNHTGTGFGGYAVTRNVNYTVGKSVFIPGCPVHPDWLILTIVHLLTKGALPPRDVYRRPTTVTIGTTIIPLFRDTIHSQCPRKPKHDAGLFATTVGDPDNCLESVGCRGKETYADCPSRGWNSTGANKTGKWCNAQGINNICIGCSQPIFPAVPFNRKVTDITYP